MRTLTNTDLNFVVRNIPSDLRKLMRHRPLFVAGGFIRETIAGAPVHDIDVFGPTATMLEVQAQALAAGRDNSRVHTTQYAHTVLAAPRMPVQFISRWLYSDAEQLLQELDFTVCQAAVWFDGTTWCSMCSEAFYPDLAARRLVYTFPQRDEEAGGSMMRVRKFLARGYNIQAESLAGVMSRVFMKVRRNCMTEDEEGTAKVVAGILREVDPLLVVDRVDFVDETQETPEST